jgi:DNA invertase Pin-like site-specific DNA recombinase
MQALNEMNEILAEVTTGVKIGYVRVSTKDQETERQIRKMRANGVEDRFMFEEKQSGKDFNRPEYQAMKRIIRRGDLVYLDALDRLGRDYDGIISEWKYITREIGADIVVLENEALFDSRRFKAMGDLGKLLEDQFLSMLAYVADAERKKNKQRQAEGIAVAVEKGIKFGRPKLAIDTEFVAAYDAWKAGSITAVAAMKQLGISKNTFYRRVVELEAERGC